MLKGNLGSFVQTAFLELAPLDFIWSRFLLRMVALLKGINSCRNNRKHIPLCLKAAQSFRPEDEDSIALWRCKAPAQSRYVLTWLKSRVERTSSVALAGSHLHYTEFSSNTPGSTSRIRFLSILNAFGFKRCSRSWSSNHLRKIALV